MVKKRQPLLAVVDPLVATDLAACAKVSCSAPVAKWASLRVHMRNQQAVHVMMPRSVALPA